MQSEEDKLQEVMGRMIYQAGVDYECVVFLLLSGGSFAHTEGDLGCGLGLGQCEYSLNAGFSYKLLSTIRETQSPS